MKQLGSSLPRFNESSRANRKVASELLLVCLGLTLAVGLPGCKSARQTAPKSSELTSPEHTEMAKLSAAIADLRGQNADLGSQLADLRTQSAGLDTQNADLRAQNVQLRQALETALDAQEQLTDEVRQISKELRSARDDLTLVRQQLHDLELERETKPAESSSGKMTAQKPQ